MSRPFDYVTFDCYGTLVDWEDGIARAFETEARRDGVLVERGAVLAAHAEIEPQIQSSGYISYRDVLTECARRIGPRVGWAGAATRPGFLADGLPGWPPFPDTNPALARLKAAGYRLGILSNVDDALLAGTLAHLEVDFDLQITAEQLRSYKPATPHFLRARDRIGGARWLHVAQSWFHDIEPACALDIPAAWINRNNEPRGGRAVPRQEFADLSGLADWLTQV